MNQGIGIGESGAEGRAGLRLCNLVAQSPCDEEGSIQAGRREGTDGDGRCCLEMICADFLAGANLEIHDKEYRNHAGDDGEENLITLCNDRHAALHRT